MPFYAHTCSTCGDFEALRSMEHAIALASCPQCGVDAPKVFRAGLSTPPSDQRGPRSVREQALSGEPRITHSLEGRRMPRRSHAH